MLNIAILGAGPMACEYAKVIQSMHIPFTVIGRSEQSARTFQEQTGINAISGGYEKYFSENNHSFTHAIVVVNENKLGEAARTAIQAGIKTILIEKPGGIDSNDIRHVANIAAKNNTKVYIGYNRRFYSSVEKAKSIISEDGGLLSFNFEFTEWGHVIENLRVRQLGYFEMEFQHLPLPTANFFLYWFARLFVPILEISLGFHYY